MAKRVFQKLLEDQLADSNFISVGLDSDPEKIPACIRQVNVLDSMVSFNTKIVEATSEEAGVGTYKLNSAFYEAHGTQGLGALHLTVKMINRIAPRALVVFDGKRGDIGNTNDQYVQAMLLAGADAATLNPYMGGETLEPFLKHADKGFFIICRTSNRGSEEFQCLELKDGRMMYEAVAENFSKKWNRNGNCGLVVGAPHPKELERVRTIVGEDMPILIPGVGAQEGDLQAVIAAGKGFHRSAFLINSSRSVIFADSGPDFADAARRETLKVRDQIRLYLAH